jgi:multiple antibiotic resistance protein
MKFFWEVFVTLIVIIDPAGIVPLFLGLTRGRSRQDRIQGPWPRLRCRSGWPCASPC